MAADLRKYKEEIEKLKDQLAKMRDIASYDDQKNSLDSEAKGHKIPYVERGMKLKRVLKGHYGKIYALHWSANGQNTLVSASQDGKLIIWNAFTNAKLHAIPLRSSWVMTCAYSASGKYVASGGLDNLCSLYKIPQPEENDVPEEYKPIVEFAEHEGYLSCCRFLNDQRILTSSGDSTCIQWDIEKKKSVSQLKSHTADVMSIAIMEDENVLVSGSCDKTAIVWDIRQTKPVMTYPGHEQDINSVDAFPGGKAFGTGSDDWSVRLFEMRAHRQIQKYSTRDMVGTSVTSVAFSKTGRYIFSGCDNFFCYVWNTTNGKNISQKLDLHENRVSCLGLSPDGYALCTGSWDSLMRIWA
ncbi:hypothetical protein AAMO2058_001525000 [Amorphochlora amoebiformis]|eukprot:519058-Amorphochlora_amoeboformis.AAC.1